MRALLGTWPRGLGFFKEEELITVLFKGGIRIRNTGHIKSKQDFYSFLVGFLTVIFCVPPIQYFVVVLCVEECVAEEDAGKVQLRDGGRTLGELPVLHVQHLHSCTGLKSSSKWWPHSTTF